MIFESLSQIYTREVPFPYFLDGFEQRVEPPLIHNLLQLTLPQREMCRRLTVQLHGRVARLIELYPYGSTRRSRVLHLLEIVLGWARGGSRTDSRR